MNKGLKIDASEVYTKIEIDTNNKALIGKKLYIFLIKIKSIKVLFIFIVKSRLNICQLFDVY